MLMMDEKLLKNLILQIEACLQDKARSFKVSDLKTSDSLRRHFYSLFGRRVVKMS